MLVKALKFNHRPKYRWAIQDKPPLRKIQIEQICPPATVTPYELPGKLWDSKLTLT